MRRAWWGIPVVAATAAIAGSQAAPELVAALLVAAAAGLVALFSPPALVLAIPFFLVQVLGEGFQVGAPLGVTQLSYVLVLVAAVRAAANRLPRGPGQVDRAFAAWFLTVAVFLVFGVVNGARPAAIKEDMVPLLALGISYVATRLIVQDERSADIVLGIILAGSLFAALKAAYLVAVPVPVGWDGQWQAIRVHRGGFTRVVLRGADVFFVAVSLLVLGRAVAGRVVRVPEAAIGLAGFAAMVVAGTRSNWLGWAAGAAMVVVTGSVMRMTRPRRAVMAVVVVTAVVFGSLGVSPTLRTWAGTLFTEAQSRMYSVDFRVSETAGILAAIRDDAWIGGGIGRGYSFWDIQAVGFVAATWSHNAYLQIVLKTGLLGLCVFLFVVGRACSLAVALSMRRRHSAPRYLGLCGAVVGVLVLSLAANKIFVLSGAMFLGLALALIQAGAAEPAE